MFQQYVDTLPDHVKVLVERYRYRDMAIKVVGVGSVGTRCWIVLLEGRDEHDPLFLQIKEADRSVLEDHLPASVYVEHGRRVVEGQRLMQAASDSFLGWTAGPDGTHYYVRQFKDMKGSVEVDGAPFTPCSGMPRYVDRRWPEPHARSGEPTAIAGYLGKSDNFDRAIGGVLCRLRRPEPERLRGVHRRHCAGSTGCPRVKIARAASRSPPFVLIGC